MATTGWPRPRISKVACLIAALLFPGSSGVLAQIPRGGSTFRPDASVTAELLMRNAEAQAAAGHWTEAIEILLRVMNDHGGTVAKLPRDDPGAGSDLYVDVRWEIQRRLATLPPEGLAVYRRRVDPQAERWFREGLEQRDRAKIRRVVTEALCSSWGDDALDHLGDMAFRDGRFSEAIAAYRRLVPDRAHPGNLDVPSPDVDLARVAAKILLCKAALGTPPTISEIESYSERFPNAEGPFTGRSGPYARSLIEALRSDGLIPIPESDSRWATFAGSPSRSRIASGPIDVGSLQWTVPLPVIAPGRESNPFVVNRFAPTRQPSPNAGLSYHPILLGDQVVVCEPERLVAYELSSRERRDGEEAGDAPAGDLPVAWDQPLPTASFGTPRTRMLNEAPRYTLTAQGDRIYGRLGPSHPRLGPSYVLAVRNNRDVEGKLMWMTRATDVPLPEPRGGTSRLATFEGSPVADERNVYIGLTEVGTMLTTYVACLDAENGSLRWCRYIGEASVPLDNMTGMAEARDLGNRLLTLDGSTLFYQTNLGALAALDAESGSLRWLRTYPSLDIDRDSIDRDLNPAIADGGTVYVAPDDCPEIMAFDAMTGRSLWKSKPLPQVTHLLGLAKGRLIATGNRVWSLDAATGEVMRYWPDAGAGMQGYGRGLLAGDFIYWPTRSEIHVLDQATGLKAERDSIPLLKAYGTTGGNLAVGDGYLLIAQEDKLVILCQNSRLLERYREQIADNPRQGAPYLRLARVAESIGRLDVALENLEGAAKWAGPSEMLDGRPLREVVREHRFRIVFRLGQDRGREGDWEQATKYLRLAAEYGLNDRDTLQARLRLAECREQAGDPAEALEILQALLLDPRFRSLTVSVDEHRSVRADRYLADRLAVVLTAGGRDLYAAHEERARVLLEEGRALRDPHRLAEVGLSYPLSRVAPDALLALAQLHEEEGKLTEAAKAYRRILETQADSQTQAEAMLALGRVYTSKGMLQPALEILESARERHGSQMVGDPGRTVEALVVEDLARPPLQQIVLRKGQTGINLPLGRGWSSRWDAAARPLLAEGIPPKPSTSPVYLAVGTRLSPLDAATGATAWSADLGSPPLWLGYQADRLVAVTESRVIALDFEDGSIRWTLDAADPQAGHRGVNPFARRTFPPTKVPTISSPRIVGQRIYVLRGDRELLAIDGDSGRLDWSYTPSKGTINPHYHVDLDRALLQIRDPNAIVQLETEFGLSAAEHSQTDADRAWAHDPLPLGPDTVGLVIEPRTVALFDLIKGGYAWTYQEPAVLPRSGPPRLLGDSRRLFAIREGSELVRLDPKTGEKKWSRILGIEDLSAHPSAIALDEEFVYCATGPAPTLTAYRLEDGEQAWRRYLVGPLSGWSLALSGDLIVTYPDPTRAIDKELSSLPLLFCHRSDGRLVQRVLFPSPVTSVAVRLGTQTALIATQSFGWSLGSGGSVDDLARTE